MKYKKYIFVLLLIAFATFSSKTVYAETEDICLYTNSQLDFKARLTVRTNYKWPITHSIGSYAEITVDKKGTSPDGDLEHINNWYPSLYPKSTKNNEYTFPLIYNSYAEANIKGKCPKYLVLQHCKTYEIWGTDSETEAQKAVNAINSVNECMGFYSSFLKSDGSRVTEEEYFAEFLTIDDHGNPISNDPEKACKSIFGEVDYAGEKDVDVNGNGKIDPPSLAYLIHTALVYVRIIVPILIILLGSLDFAKAVTAGKEDEMKKAQKTFVRRLIAGIIVFFVPTLIDLIMGLADIIWEGLGYSHCSIPM